MAANWPIYSFASMGSGTARMIELFGTPEQKGTYLKKLYAGKWGGTMLLTEPEAGSDVGAILTSARRNPDGAWSLTGNKIFITRLPRVYLLANRSGTSSPLWSGCRWL